jgi:uncharacterized membrane protein YdfJ with MMPL/SSD domain
MQPSNLAARAGRWSAQHRKTAILGWIAFMVLAVAHGLKATAGVVTSAALVMVAVFGSFALGSDQLAKQIGVGLASAILIDATIVRAVLLPATLKLLGERNWYLPRRLGRLPRLELEAQTASAGA